MNRYQDRTGTILDESRRQNRTSRTIQDVGSQQILQNDAIDSDLQNNLPSLSNEYPRKLLQGLNDLRVRKDLCDVTIVVDDKEFDAHKNVLSACSPYFKAMFTTNTLESKQNTVTLHELDKDAVEIIIDFAYTAQVTILDSNVQALLAAATLLQMPEIQLRCCEYIKLQLDAVNCLGIRDIADKYSCHDLLDSANTYTLEAFEEVVKHEEFLRLSVDQLIEVISSDTLNVKSEEKVYEAVMRWVNYLNSPDGNRSCHLPNVIQHVRLSQMNPHYLVKVSNNPLIKAHEKCREYVDEAKNYLLLPDAREDMCGPRFRRRKKQNSSEKLYAVGGWVSGDAIASVERYEPDTDKWTVMTEMQSARCGVGVAVLDNVLFAVGGHDGSVYLNSIESYQPQYRKWNPDIKPLPSARTSVGVATLNGFLYVIGGQEGPNSLDLVDKYDPDNNIWTKCAHLGSKRLGAGVAVLDDYIYAVGGADKNNSLKTVERYDPRLNQWQLVAPMITKRKHLGCTAFGGYIYAVGGRDDSHELDSAERYDPSQNVWEKIPSMSIRRSGVGSAVINGLLYAVGGFDGSSYLKTVEVYDIATKLWSTRSSMSYRRLGGGVAVMK